MNTNMKPRTVIGILFVVASLLKLATLWGILHWSWFETISEGRWAMYFYIFIILWVGVHLIIDSYRRDPDQWLTDKDVPCLHIVANNFLGGVDIKN